MRYRLAGVFQQVAGFLNADEADVLIGRMAGYCRELAVQLRLVK